MNKWKISEAFYFERGYLRRGIHALNIQKIYLKHYFTNQITFFFFKKKIKKVKAKNLIFYFKLMLHSLKYSKSFISF